ncbi:hypothetical protein GIS00_23195 [Nakamurella sp. YIM 132087]|uniref:Uncharacterized protein n=1 Tax=Nakamurella alba TaxID=2665158 RepID=A0A7K1FVJ1_9ACTN|nr:hypothetical protein [Nakamurella alba]MTD16844.1 hypothetical protein [Nakamurella alba]
MHDNHFASADVELTDDELGAVAGGFTIPRDRPLRLDEHPFAGVINGMTAMDRLKYELRVRSTSAVDE